MKLMTKKIEEKLLEYGIDGHIDRKYNSIVIARYFNPFGIGTWLITGGKKLEDGDWLLYGFVSLLYNEWGYILLSELESFKLSNGMEAIERDKYLQDDTTVYDECVRLGINCCENG